MIRVILVGSAAARERLRAELPEGLEIVGEAATMGEARDLWAEHAEVDAWLVAPDDLPDRLHDRSNRDLVEPLTARELEVLELLAQGLPNKSIAVRLGISDQTVKFHVAAICGKLGAANRTDAAHRALRRGLIPL